MCHIVNVSHNQMRNVDQDKLLRFCVDGSHCSKAVDLMSYDQEVVGLIPAKY